MSIFLFPPQASHHFHYCTDEIFEISEKWKVEKSNISSFGFFFSFIGTAIGQPTLIIGKFDISTFSSFPSQLNFFYIFQLYSIQLFQQ